MRALVKSGDDLIFLGDENAQRPGAHE